MHLVLRAEPDASTLEIGGASSAPVIFAYDIQASPENWIDTSPESLHLGLPTVKYLINQPLDLTN